jgi:hypothetical protein
VPLIFGSFLYVTTGIAGVYVTMYCQGVGCAALIITVEG